MEGQPRAEDIVGNVGMASKIHYTSCSFLVSQIVLRWLAVTKTMMATTPQECSWEGFSWTNPEGTFLIAMTGRQHSTKPQNTGASRVDITIAKIELNKSSSKIIAKQRSSYLKIYYLVLSTDVHFKSVSRIKRNHKFSY